jgi:putative oxidoreductase
MFEKLTNPQLWTSKSADLASLVLRLALGSIMMSHGIPKLMNLLSGTIAFGDPIGIGITTSLTLVVFAEFFCSILIIFGFWTRLALIPLIITMLVAVFIVHINEGIGKMELALIYLLSYCALFLLGSGKYSIDEYFKRKK